MPFIYFLFYLIFFEVVVSSPPRYNHFLLCSNFPGQNSKSIWTERRKKLHYRWHTAPFKHWKPTPVSTWSVLETFGNTSSCMHTNNLQSVKVSWGLCRAPPSQKSPFVSSPSQECWADGNLSAWGHIPVNSSPAHLQGTWGQLPSPCITGHRNRDRHKLCLQILHRSQSLSKLTAALWKAFQTECRTSWWLDCRYIN